MADITDVENALVSLIAGVLYPSGTGQPSITALPTIVYAGWPQSAQLDTDMAGFTNGQGGRIHVTVFSTATEKNTTRYPRTYAVQTPAATTLTLTTSGQQVTVGGTVSTPQNVGLIVNGQPYLYAVAANDTLASIASALAAQVSGATSSGAVITLPATARLTAARVGGVGTLAAQTKQQQRTMQITVWADTPGHRSATAAAIDSALSALDFLTLADGSMGRLTYVASRIDDMVQKANLYRRDLLYAVEYATLATASATDVLTLTETFKATTPDGTSQTIATKAL